MEIADKKGIVLRSYQSDGINSIIEKIRAKTRRTVFQLPTGGGKTVMFAELARRFTGANPSKQVVIIVHRAELLKQAYNAMKRVGIEAGVVVAGARTVSAMVDGYYIPYPEAKVIICMVDTLNNRLKKYDQYFSNPGLVIIDECHLSHFKKIYDSFERCLIIGFSATPKMATKKDPLRNHFDDIVCGPSIKYLVDNGFLCHDVAIRPGGLVNRASLARKGNEFDEKKMAIKYSATRHIKNTVYAYEKYGAGKKTLVFNCNVEHSKFVNNQFVEQGYNSRHLDGTMSEEQRRDTLKWFSETDDAILNSVAILTVGFDEPTIQTIILNRSMLSLPLFLQCVGRGSRTHPTKEGQFLVLDMGDNYFAFGGWSVEHNWHSIFHHPERVGSGGLSPVKSCVECNAIIHASINICPYCLANNEKEKKYDQQIINFEIISGNIDVGKIAAQNRSYKPYRSVHIIKHKLLRNFRIRYVLDILPTDMRKELCKRYDLLIIEWARVNNIPYTDKVQAITQKWLYDELNRIYGKI